MLYQIRQRTDKVEPAEPPVEYLRGGQRPNWFAVGKRPDRPTAVEEGEGAPGRPGGLRLEQSFPNPFNASTSLRFSLPVESRVWLAVYDLRGSRVALLEAGTKPAGTH